MKGTITPGDKFNRVDKIIDASSLKIDMEMDENQTILSAKLQVITTIVHALIISGEKFKSDDALVTRAKSIAKKILEDGKKEEKES